MGADLVDVLECVPPCLERGIVMGILTGSAVVLCTFYCVVYLYLNELRRQGCGAQTTMFMLCNGTDFKPWEKPYVLYVG
jgi:hypothetical protein